MAKTIFFVCNLGALKGEANLNHFEFVNTSTIIEAHSESEAKSLATERALMAFPAHKGYSRHYAQVIPTVDPRDLGTVEIDRESEHG